jgi:hypothetical protein
MFTTRYSAHVHGACRQVGCQQGGLVRRDQRQQRCVLRRSVRLVTPSLLSAPYHPARRRTHTNHLVFVSPCTVPTTTFATHLSPQRPSPHICPHNDLRHTSVPTTTFATHLSPQRPSPHICPHNDLRHTSVDPTTTFATHLSPQRPSPHICRPHNDLRHTSVPTTTFATHLFLLAGYPAGTHVGLSQTVTTHRATLRITLHFAVTIAALAAKRLLVCPCTLPLGTCVRWSAHLCFDTGVTLHAGARCSHTRSTFATPSTTAASTSPACATKS